MKKQPSNVEYRLDRATSFQDNRGREITLPPNTRLVYGGYSPEGRGQFTVTAGKENGRKVEADSVPAENFRGGAADRCRSCGQAFAAGGPARSIMVPDLC
ncbi:MAG TPA: hypothetical protein VKY74_16865, partial [Chloroflexia bacterium]|nr:hypothetical protein [Chloroflexia bacterium]